MPIEKLFEAMSTALGESDGQERAGASMDTETSAPGDDGTQGQEPAASAGDASGETDSNASETPAHQPERARGPDGKFTKGGAQPAAAPPPKAQAPKPTQPAGAPPAQSQQPASPAPRTWAPAAREHWAALPREVKDQVLKMEGLASRAHQELQQVKQAHGRMQEALQPFVPHLQAMGVAPEAAVRELFQLEYTLRTGTPAQRTGIIAHLMARGGVTPDALATVLEGKSLPQAQQQEFRDPRVDDLLGQFQQLGKRRSEDATAKALSELQAFEATGPEFLADVADQMADLIASARRRGKPITLQQAYDKACQLDDNVRPILEQRRAEEKERAQKQRAAQVRYAAGSIQSEPAPPTGGKKAGIAGMWDALQQNLGE